MLIVAPHSKTLALHLEVRPNARSWLVRQKRRIGKSISMVTGPTRNWRSTLLRIVVTSEMPLNHLYVTQESGILGEQ